MNPILVRKTLLIIFACALIVQAADEVCRGLPNGTGFVPHNQECAKYYSCVNFVSHLLTCPSPFYFDSCNIQCRLPNIIDEACKCQFCPRTGVHFFPNTTSRRCDDYVMCVNGIEVSMRCPTGLSFDNATNSCVEASKLNCFIDTCAMTWSGTLGRHAVGFAPSSRSCNEYLICSRGEIAKNTTCPSNFVYDLNGITVANGVSFNGRCTAPSTNVKCFDGDNWTAPPFN